MTYVKKWQPCPHCGERSMRRRYFNQTLSAPLGDYIRYYCTRCHKDFFAAVDIPARYKATSLKGE